MCSAVTLNDARKNGVIDLTKTKANAYDFAADHAYPPLSLTFSPLLLACLAVNR
jgi:tRNA A22 N-methylase